MNRIGQLNEQHLHHALKLYYARENDRIECLIDGYIVDVVREDGLIEIQTGNFSAIRQKIANLVQNHQVKLVYPIAIEKWLLKLPKNDEKGEPKRRKSPKTGRKEAVFFELVSFPALLKHPNFSIELAMIQEEEIRRFKEGTHWRNHGWQTVERRLIKVLETVCYENPAQMAGFLPESLPEHFTTADLSKKASISRGLAQKMAYCLREMGAIKQVGKRNRSNLYTCKLF
jgi:hypothetical protein